MQASHSPATPEVMAVVLPDGTPGDATSDFVATGTLLLVRYADGRLALEPARQSAAWQDKADAPDCFRNSKPILDPVSREVMGYEMELQEWPMAS